MRIKRLLAGVLTVLLTVTSVPNIEARAAEIDEPSIESSNESSSEASSEASSVEVPANDASSEASSTEDESGDNTNTGAGTEEDGQQTDAATAEGTEEGQKEYVTVTFNANGGMFADEADTVTYEVEKDGTLEAMPSAPVYDGYEFSGWYYDSESAESADVMSISFAEDKTFYAGWTEEEGGSSLFSQGEGIKVNYWVYYNKYEAYYDNRTGNLLMGTYYVQAGDTVYPSINDEAAYFAANMKGYTFTGWYTEYDSNPYWDDNVDQSKRVVPGTTPLPANGETELNVYAHFKLATVAINIEPGEHASVEYVPDEYGPKTFHRGDEVAIYAKNPGSWVYGGHIITPEDGYCVEGLYTSPDFDPATKIAAEYSDNDYWKLLINDRILSVDDEGNNSVKLYAKTSTYNIRIKLRQYTRGIGYKETYYKNGKFVSVDDVINDLPTVADINGYNFGGWGCWSRTGNEYLTGESGFRVGDARLGYDSDGVYCVELIGKWNPAEYTIRFHLNNSSNDIVQEYKCKEHTAPHTSLDVNTMYGVVSGNSSFTDKSLDFTGWALDPKGEVVFDKGLTAAAIRKYCYDKGQYSIDVYAKWEGSEEYKFDLQIKAFDDVTAIDYAAEDFTGSDYTIASASDLVQVDESFVNETIVLTGTEFVRKGYALSGWNYTTTRGGVATTKALKAAATITEKTKPESAVLTAIWTPVNYTIKYNLNGGTMAVKGTKTSFGYNKDENRAATALLNYQVSGAGFVKKADADLDVTKAGYTFDGWFVGDTSYDHYKGDVYENLTLTAKWSLNTYDITFNGNSGKVSVRYSNSGEQDALGFRGVAYTTTFDLSQIVATRPGYKFKNWTDGSGKTYAATAKIKSLTTVNGQEVSFTAQWTANTNTITYNLDGGVIPKNAQGKAQTNPRNYLTGNAVALIAPEKVGFDFDHWELTQTGVPAGAAFLNDDGDAIAAGSYGNVTLKAVYTPHTYNLYIHMNLEDQMPEGDPDEGKANREIGVNAVRYNEVVSLNAFAMALENGLTGVNAGRTITGFTAVENGKTRKFDLLDYTKLTTEAEIHLYAQWSDKKSYRILYELNGGTMGKRATTYTSGAATKIAIPTKTGYVFDGWTVESVAGQANEMMMWQPGGVLGQDEVAYSEDAKHNLTIAKDNARDIFLVAHWSPVRYKVLVDNNQIGNYYYQSSTGFDNADANYVVVKPGYTYGGTWTLANGKGKRLNSSAALAEDGQTYTITYNAADLEMLTTKNDTSVKFFTYWLPRTKTITFDGTNVVVTNGSTFLNAAGFGIAQVTVGKAYTLPKVTAQGYTFLGWKVDADSEPYYTDDLGDLKATVNKAGYITAIAKDNTVDATLTPVFSQNQYSAKLSLGGGNLYYNGRKITGTYNLGSGLQSMESSAYLNGMVTNILAGGSFQRKGYVFKGLALDSKGNNMITGNADQFLAPVKQNKGTLTIHAIWEKATPAKPAKVSAKLSNKTLTISIKDQNPIGVKYYAEYSSSMLFLSGKTDRVYIDESGLAAIPDAYGSKYYVRVKAYREDSYGNDNYSAYSSTVRANRVTQ